MIGRTLRLSAIVLIFISLSVPAHATGIVFDFNSLASGKNSTGGGISPNGSIQNYMNYQLQQQGVVGASVAVAGAKTDKAYDGDNHVVGPCAPNPLCGAGGNVVTPLTLGTSDNAAIDGTPRMDGTLDTFIKNVSGIDRFTMTFTGLLINSVSFDWQIFPDASCVKLIASKCGGAADGDGHFPNQPDFKFYVDDNTLIFRYWGLTPGAAGGSPYKESLVTDNGNAAFELTPQLIGTGTWYFNTPVTKLSFVDWPATIAIDNLAINVPEPGTLILLGLGLAATGLVRRRRS